VNAWAWLLQRISAVVLLIALGLHIWFLHFAGGGEVLHYSDIEKRLDTAIFISLDILLLIFGFYHALYGLYSIFLDFTSGSKERIVILALLVVAGIGFSGFGIWGLLWFR
jgi:succinate dehydrogenase / fumarate reductase membrane anchor subunit